MIRPRTFFDFTVADVPAGRVVFELFTDLVPKTSENFRALCTGELGRSKTSDIPLHYKGSTVHRSVANFMIQGGDFTKGNGKGGESIYGEPFDDEDLSRALDSEGLLCMANKGPNTNGSQWFITLKECPHLNGKHVVFGRVASGFDIVKRISEIPTDEKSRPLQPVVISHSAELELRRVPPKLQAPARGRSTSVSSSERKKKRRHSSDSRGSESESEDESRKRKHKHRSKKDKEKHRPSKDKDRSKKKSRRSRSPSDDRDRDRDRRAASPREETLDELDARLEREEKERLAAAKRKELEDLKMKAVQTESSTGVRFKGRGRMKFKDPELERRGRFDDERSRY
ncbi:hypothetical protein FRB90_001366 [Tulasnella sp. 427]|nr:hypothetical protein FRB90_001366 [Tulasnella sp. 427]